MKKSSLRHIKAIIDSFNFYFLVFFEKTALENFTALNTITRFDFDLV